ncbi:non-ribosomal peptide synthetase [Nocardia arthritidis]|uniref:Amino acid adenylation domain-containing protein n=1 Tax=Nocardia arthritidis TaxID=228602 RepID=A0A6G9YIF3_9NOCA|nr:non-ribosomal peptide synthetase [Nocardia arthritidis]QIS12940.1 amino acid adenylation domain-containing protein [Nocardia arthritidis]
MNSPASELALARLRQRRAAGPAVATIAARTGSGPYPATAAQRGIRLHEQLADNPALYHVPFGIRISGPLDVAALKTAAADLIRQQHTLRTVFADTPAGLRATVADVVDPDWRDHDLRLIPEAARDSAVAEQLSEFACAPFDLAVGPPVRWTLLRVGGQEWVLGIVAHHLVLDGISIGLLIDRLWSAYDARRAGVEPELAPRRQYADYATWLAENPSATPSSASVRRRAALVDGVPALDVATRPRPRRVRNDGARVRTDFPHDLAESVRKCAAANEVPPFVFLLACYELVLAAHTGQDEFCVGIPMAGRPYTELADTIGHFVNTVPIRSDLAAARSFRDLLHRTRDTALAAYADETIPFERVVETIGGPWDPAFSPVFQVLFVQQRLDRPAPTGDGLALDWQPIETGATLYDLVFHLAETGSGFACELTYNTAVLDEPVAIGLVRDVLTVARAAAWDPTAAITELTAELPRRYLSIHVLESPDGTVAAGIAAALARGSVPARVTGGSTAELPDDQVDLLVVRDSRADVAELVKRCADGGIVCLLVGPTGQVRTRGAIADTRVVELDERTAADDFATGWLVGRRVAELSVGDNRLATWGFDRSNNRAAQPIPEEPERQDGLGTQAGGSEAPVGPLEQRLAALFAQALDLPEVGRHDDFFLLGGTSLGATRVLAQLLDEFAVTVSLRELFEHPTVAQAALLLESAPAQENSLPALRPAARADGDLLPVSYAQERLWFLEALDPGNSTHIMPGGLRLRGAVDIDALELALSRVEKRHEVLRTVYRTTEDGELRQLVRPATPRPLPHTDIGGLPAERAARIQTDLTAAVYAAPFDLAEGPVWRYHLLTTGPGAHLLLIALHHIACDGWSLAVLSQEVAAVYRAATTGGELELPPLPVQYPDYAVWQRDIAGRLENQLDYWRTELADPPVTELPGDRPRPPRRSGRGAVARRTIDPAVQAQVRALAAELGVTGFAVLLATFYLVLNRYTRQRDLIVAAPIAGRTRAATEPLVGCFLNTLALRGRVDPERSCRDLIAEVGQVVLAAHANQDAPFEKVIEALVPDRDPSRTPLAQIMFNYLNTPPPTYDMAGLDVEFVDAPRSTARMDLDLTVDETGAAARLELEYSTDIYDAATADRLLRHYAEALARVVAQPGLLVGEVALEEPNPVAVIPDWPLPGTPSVPERGSDDRLTDRLARHIAERPGAVALSAGENAITYAELGARSANMAAALVNAVAPGARVALLFDHTPDSFVAVWAVLRAGLTYVPLDPRAPLARLREIIDEAKVAALLCDPALAELAAAVAGDSIAVIAAVPTAATDSAVVPEDAEIAYILHTSGSTGRPKGVAQSRDNALFHAVRYARRLRLGPDDVVAGSSRYTFDAGALHSFGAAVAGARLHVLDPHDHDPAGLRAAIEAAGITVLHCTPTLFRYLLSDIDEPWLPATLRLVAFGGEEVVRGDVRDFARHFPAECRLVSLYGPSECSVALQHLITAADAERDGVPIGHPVAGVGVELVDENGRPTEVYGEIALRGEHVALGYWRRPELTEAAFGIGSDGVRYYRTGDLARRLPDGELVFAGRKDRQVKIRGHRVEPGEAETFLRSHPTVGEAAVVLDTAAAEPRLVAYLTQDGPLTPDPRELSAYLRTRLPDYMIPSAYLVLDTLPRGMTGKLDRSALPPIAPPEPPVWSPPGTELEKAVAEIWGQVLGREVGLGQNFFDLGGHSLALARVRGLLERRLNVELALTDLFAAPTVDDLARLLSGRLAPAAESDRGRERRAAMARRTADRRPRGRADREGSRP